MLKVTPNQSPKRSCLGSINDSVEAFNDHQVLLDRYLQSHRIRNHSGKTIAKEKAFLESWFQTHGNHYRPLMTWEAMEPIIGRQRIIDYANTLLDNELTANTVRAYLGILNRYFAYVLEYPFITTTSSPQKICDKYGEISGPVSEFDLPKHSYDGERLGIPFDPEKLYQFYSVIKRHYLLNNRYPLVSARNYTMVVLAGESGLRVDEILNLELVDLFFDSDKIQTRWAKGTKGSGKRARTTLFTPLAQDTVKFYLSSCRPNFPHHQNSQWVFLSKSGRQLDYSAAHSGLKQMVKCANKQGFKTATHMSYHWLRRFFATRFIERFPNQLSVLINLLGHLTPNTVHCYIRHSEAWMDDQIQQMLKGTKKWPLVGN